MFNHSFIFFKSLFLRGGRGEQGQKNTISIQILHFNFKKIFQGFFFVSEKNKNEKHFFYLLNDDLGYNATVFKKKNTLKKNFDSDL